MTIGQLDISVNCHIIVPFYVIIYNFYLGLTFNNWESIINLNAQLVFNTKHHLKFGKNQADNLGYM